MLRFRYIAIICSVAFSPIVAMSAEETTQRALGNPASIKSCVNCHDAPAVTSVLHTAHALQGDTRTGAADDGCQSCHGDSAAHVARVPEGKLRPPPKWVFDGPNASPAGDLNNVCSSCHVGGSMMHWEGSLHASSDITCANCHKSHPVRDDVLVSSTQSPICFSCHAYQKSAALRPSHHPVVEGQMACSDCHNPHGSVAANMLVGLTVNDTCLGCHDEKRGPFLWEHPPAQEQCTICHTPHGSVQASLLKQRPPYLCQNCHESSLHNSQPFSGANLPGGAFPSRQLVQRGCLNCHGQIHGSNHPSGARFSR